MAQEKFQKLSFGLHVIYDMTYVQQCFLPMNSGTDNFENVFPLTVIFPHSYCPNSSF
jgi:hypothetical protein